MALWDPDGSAGFRQELRGYTDEAFVVAFSPNGEIVAIGDEKGRVYLHGVGAGAPSLEGRCDEHDGATALRFSDSGSMLACGGANGPVMIWDMKGARPLVWTRKSSSVTGLVFTPDETTLVSTDWKGVVTRWDVKTGTSIPAPWQGPHGGPVAFSPDWKYRVSADPGGAVVLWDAPTGRQHRILLEGRGENVRVSAVAFSPNGRRLVASVGPRQHVWTVDRWDSHDTYATGNARDIAFAADSRTLAAAGDRGGIYLLDVDAKEQMAEPLKGPRSANRIVFSRQGMRLAASFGGGYPPMIWDLDLQGMQRWACRLANRDLTAAEWRELAGPLPQPRICPPA